MSVRQASTLLVLRDGDQGLQVLMLRRSRELFGGGWWVFPGGAVDDVDRGALADRLITGLSDADRPWVSAAVRETAEEVNLFLVPERAGWADLAGEDLYRAMVEAGEVVDGAAIGFLSNWITPEQVKKRFDTRFYVVAFDGDEDLVPDEGEVDAIEWVRPAEMLARDREAYPLIFPTIKHLELLARFETAGQVVEYALARDVVPVRPEMRRGPDDEVILSIPGHPDFVDAPALRSDVT